MLVLTTWFLPSYEEVWGLVVNEALASGVKVIASNVCGCVPDLVISSSQNFVFKQEIFVL